MSYKNKCFSSCRGIPEDKCKTRKCSYAQGSKRSYCRIGKEYKLHKTTCKMIPKFKKTKQGKMDAAKQIQQLYRKYKNKGKSKSKNNDSIENTNNKDNVEAANKIQRFFKRTTQKRQSEFLKAICPRSGSCLAFGRENVKIYNFFHGFVSTDYMKGKMNRIGKASANGFIYELEYKKRDYNAFAILKSSQSAEADNLAYEYMVGQFVNNIMVKYPCFLETYGLYQYKSEAGWRNMSKLTTNSVSINNFIKVTSLTHAHGYKIDYKNICANSKYLAVLIQHIKNPSTNTQTMDDLLKNRRFVLNDCIYAYYQIYFVLSAIRDIFTHYDLHNDNIMLYKPDEDGYIEYHYTLDNGYVTSFCSPYVAKIIDYGRCYFNDVGEISSKDVQQELCKKDNESECVETCGDEVGFTFMPPVPKGDLKYNYFISSGIPNVSHDLRALNQAKNRILDTLYFDSDDSDDEEEKVEKEIIEKVGNFVKHIYKVKYSVGMDDMGKENRIYGTIQNKASGYPSAVNNVSDAEHWLRDIINTPSVKKYNQELYSTEKGKFKIGDMYVHQSVGNCRFVPFIK